MSKSHWMKFKLWKDGGDCFVKPLEITSVISFSGEDRDGTVSISVRCGGTIRVYGVAQKIVERIWRYEDTGNLEEE